MSRSFKKTLKKTLGFSIVATALMAPALSQAQHYGAYPGWGSPVPYGAFDAEDDNWAPQQNNAANSPAAVLRDGVEKLTQFLSGRPNRAALAAYLEQTVVPFFDFDYMAEWAGGRRFFRLDPALQLQLRTRMKTSFLESMAEKLGRYSQQRAVFLAPQQDGPGEVTLPIAIENPAGGYPAHLEFRMRQTDKGWRVIDVSANGMSALLFYREMFNEMMHASRQPTPPMRRY